MRWIAWLLLACGPLLAAPAAAGLWTRARLAGVHGAELYGLSAAAGAMLVEGLLISVRGLVREVTVFMLSGFWAMWLWFGMTDEGYDWTSLPAIHVPDPVGRMMVMLIMLVYLTLYAVAESRPLRARA
jgi:hypothetical protein